MKKETTEAKTTAPLGPNYLELLLDGSSTEPYPLTQLDELVQYATVQGGILEEVYPGGRLRRFPLLVNAKGKPVEELREQEFIDRFPEEERPSIHRLVGQNRDAEALVCFQDDQTGHPAFGCLTAVAVGGRESTSTVLQAVAAFVEPSPGDRRYAIAIWRLR